MKINIPFQSIELKDITSDIKELIDTNHKNLAIDISGINKDVDFNELLQYLININEYYSEQKIVFITNSLFLSQNLKKMHLNCHLNDELSMFEEKKQEKQKEETQQKNENFFINQKVKHIRSGSRLYVQEKNVLVIDSIRSGGELICDGSVTVLGKSTGKIIAGVKDPNSFVICNNFESELISINGVYATGNETEDYIGQSVLVELNEEGTKLIFRKVNELG